MVKVVNIPKNKDRKYYRYPKWYLKTKRKESDDKERVFGEILDKAIKNCK